MRFKSKGTNPHNYTELPNAQDGTVLRLVNKISWWSWGGCVLPLTIWVHVALKGKLFGFCFGNTSTFFSWLIVRAGVILRRIVAGLD